VPEVLKDKTIVALELGSPIAGTQSRGEFEERQKRVMDEVAGSHGKLSREGATTVEGRGYERATTWRDEADVLQAEYREARDRWLEESGTRDAAVGREEIARAVGVRTGIPVTGMLKDEAERLLSMEEALRERVIGQEAAGATVSEAVRKVRADFVNPNRPSAASSSWDQPG